MLASTAAASARPAFIPPPPRSADADGYTVESETVLHKRYLTVYDRQVSFPAQLAGGGQSGTRGAEEGAGGQQGAAEHRLSFSYDVIGHPRAHFHAVWCLPYHAVDGTVSLLREYAHGPHELLWTLPAGGVDPEKHESLEAAARAELSEEASLRGGELVRLLPDTHPGIVEAKWCANRFTPFLCLDAEGDSAPGQRDAEEATMTVHRVPLQQLQDLLDAGALLPPAFITATLALAELRRRGIVR